MQIIIEIPEDEYNKICSGNFDTDGYFKMNLKETFRNATPLPKKHGRLIDADDIKSYFSDREGGDFTAFHFYDAVENAPTIIEADKE